MRTRASFVGWAPGYAGCVYGRTKRLGGEYTYDHFDAGVVGSVLTYVAGQQEEMI